MGFYDDNYGWYDGADDPGVQDFYRRTQRQSVWKDCADCGRRVKIKRDYDCCNRCADIREGGGY